MSGFSNKLEDIVNSGRPATGPQGYGGGPGQSREKIKIPQNGAMGPPPPGNQVSRQARGPNTGGVPSGGGRANQNQSAILTS